MTKFLSEFEVDVLRTIGGQRPKSPISWGAAMSEALGALKGAGLVELIYYEPHSPDVARIEYHLTEEGRKALEEQADADD